MTTKRVRNLRRAPTQPVGTVFVANILQFAIEALSILDRVN